MLYNSFDDFKARAGHEIDGLWYPRVTSILSIKAKPGLYMYYANLPNFRTAEAIKNKSAEEGQLVHDTIEAILRKEPITVPDSIRPTVEAFQEFYQNNTVIPLKIEERILSKKHHYSGTIDILAEVNGVVGVLDIKTSQAVYREYGMQTAAYIEALREDAAIPPITTSWILRLDQAQSCAHCKATMRSKGGNAKVRGGFGSKVFCAHEWDEPQGVYEFKELPHFDQDIRAFLAAKTLWEWEHANYLNKLKERLV